MPGLVHLAVEHGQAPDELLVAIAETSEEGRAQREKPLEPVMTISLSVNRETVDTRRFDSLYQCLAHDPRPHQRSSPLLKLLYPLKQHPHPPRHDL